MLDDLGPDRWPGERQGRGRACEEPEASGRLLHAPSALAAGSGCCCGRWAGGATWISTPARPSSSSPGSAGRFSSCSHWHLRRVRSRPLGRDSHGSIAIDPVRWGMSPAQASGALGKELLDEEGFRLALDCGTAFRPPGPSDARGATPPSTCPGSGCTVGTAASSSGSWRARSVGWRRTWFTDDEADRVATRIRSYRGRRGAGRADRGRTPGERAPGPGGTRWRARRSCVCPPARMPGGWSSEARQGGAARPCDPASALARPRRNSRMAGYTSSGARRPKRRSVWP